MSVDLGAQRGAHVFVADLGRPELGAEDRHHLARVLRVRPGDALTVSDGVGGWRPCVFGDELEPVGDIVRVAAPDPPITIGFALVKGERPELVVQKLTELGIDRICPFVAERSVVRWDEERADRHVDRLRKVAHEASMQSKRCRLPVVDRPRRFADLLRDGTAPVALAERGGHQPSLRCRTVLIGPEGGWSRTELAASVETMSFGEQVLRAETAAITAAGVLAAIRSGLVAVRD